MAKKDKKKPEGALWVLIGVGTQLSSTVIAGFMMGWGLDYLLNTQPIFMMAFGLLGFVGGLLNVHRFLSGFN